MCAAVVVFPEPTSMHDECQMMTPPNPLPTLLNRMVGSRTGVIGRLSSPSSPGVAIDEEDLDRTKEVADFAVRR